MKEESVKIYYLVPVSSSEENDKDEFAFIDFEILDTIEEKGKDKFVFIDFEMLDTLRRSLYVNDYKGAVNDAKILSDYLKQDVAVVELKKIVKFRPKRIQKVKRWGKINEG